MDKALLILDMVNGYVYGEKPLVRVEKRTELIENIRRVVKVARLKKVPVIYVNSAFRKSDPILRVIGQRSQAIEGTKESEVIPELIPKKEDFVVEKRGYDGFWKSNLEKLLKKLKVEEIFLCGEQTDCCVRETAVTAAHLGYKVFVIEDCCDTSRELGHETALKFVKSCAGMVINSKDLLQSLE